MKTLKMILMVLALVAVTTLFVAALAADALAPDPWFEPRVDYGAGTGPTAVFAADFDGDNDNDLAVAIRDADSVVILENIGNGTFQPAGSYSAGSWAFAVCSNDFNGDNHKDLAVANYLSSNVSVLIGNGDGTFQSTVNYSCGVNPQSVFSADIDGDGDNDLATANYFNDDVSILFNNGDGTFQAPLNLPVGDQGHGVIAFDLDSDDDLDLAVSNNSSGNVSILINIGDGDFQPAVNYGCNHNPNDIASGDFDGDGDRDLVVSNDNSQFVSVLMNNGDATFQAPVTYSVGTNPYSVVASDLDNDGDYDLAVANTASNNISVLENPGNGTFEPAIHYDAGIWPYHLIAAEVDGDGDSDLVLVNHSSNNVSIYLNNSSSSILLPSVTVRPCDACEIGYGVQPVVTKLSQPINGASIPIAVPSGVEICDITTAGCITDSWDYVIIDDKSDDSGFVFVALANTLGERIPVDTSTVFFIHFRAARECATSTYIHWDTTLSDDPGRALLFSDTLDFDLAAHFDVDRDSTEVEGYIPGDLTDDGAVNITDLTRLVAYLFSGGVAPCVLNSSDVNGSCGLSPNIADLTYFIAYLFRGGPAPLCGCIGTGAPAPKRTPGAFVSTHYTDGVTTVTVESPIDLRGLQFEMKLVDGSVVTAVPVSIANESLDLLYNTNDVGLLNVGILDLDGGDIIASGTHSVIQLEGKYEIISALGSDLEHREVVISVGKNQNEPVAPFSYTLNQNYPNPFNPTTTIGFSVEKQSGYSLTIYNVTGQMVRQFNGVAEAGANSVVWDASSSGSGVYFYRLETATFTDTKKMILLK